MDEPTDTIETTCCIAGGGPAGMVLGLLLARAGVSVVVLEKHADFLRDFRGDTLHPSTLDVLHEIGLLDAMLARPHQKAAGVSAWVDGREFAVADFRHVPARCPYIAFVPQWDFLDLLAEHGRRYAGFDLRMRTEATGLLEEDGRVVGVRAGSPGGEHLVRADLVVGADGRESTLRAAAALPVRDLGAPIDVLWFRVDRRPEDPTETMGRFGAGRILVMIERGTYWQCGYVIAKGSMDAVRARGLEAFRDGVARLAPFLRGRLEDLRDWSPISPLTVRVDRLDTWHRRGLLCIGDAAHAMSPVGGVGINLAVQDAVAAANLLWRPLRDGRLSEDDLRAVQRRREWPTRVTQRMQVAVQERIIGSVLRSDEALRVPVPLRVLSRCGLLRRIPGRLIGIGVRPEHVACPDATE